MYYSIKKIETDEKSLHEIARFLKEIFPKTKKFTPAFVKWQYAMNPLGPMVGFNAWDGDRIISHFAGMPVLMNLFGKERKGLLIINISTNAAYRGKRLFTILGEETIKYATESGYDFMIGAANANSIHGFLKNLGFYLISPLSAKVGFGKNIFPSREFDCYKLWSTELWKWRLGNPANKYSYDKKGIVSSPISFFAKTVSKADLSGIQPNISESKNIFRPLNLYVGLGADTSRGIYFNIPSFVKRPPFNLIFKSLTDDIPKLKKDDIFTQLIDFDNI